MLYQLLQGTAATAITRTRKAYEITALALALLQKEAYESFHSVLPKVSFEMAYD